MSNTEHVSHETPDLAAERRAQLAQLFPEAFSEGKVDFDKLRAALGDLADDRRERYNFTWAGKQDAVLSLQTPSQGTLKPVHAESIDFDASQNVFIEGENLEVLKLLYKSYFGRVKMIYIDPPYNTGNDFIYLDDYAHPLNNYLRLTGQKDSSGNFLTSNPETNGRYHSAWLSMMYPRLFIARQLLQDDGVIFISIDDNEVHDLRMLMNEIFGEENFVTTIIWQKVFAPKNTAKHFSEDHDFVLVYAKNADIWRPNLLARTEQTNARYDNPDNDPRGIWSSSDLTARNYYSQGQYEVTGPTGKKFKPTIGSYWRIDPERFNDLNQDNRIWWGETGENMPRLKRFLSEVRDGVVPQTLWRYKAVGHTQEAKRELLSLVPFEFTENVLNTVKPTRLIELMLHIATSVDTKDIIIDFFGGSGVTGHAVLKKNAADGGNRRFVIVQLPEPLPKPESSLKTIADIAKTRLQSVIREIESTQSTQLPLVEQKQSLGIKIFKLAESNYKYWPELTSEIDPDEYARQMALFVDPLKDDWMTEDVIVEVAIKEGYSLTCQVDQVREVTSATVYRVVDEDKEQFFTICLDKSLSLDALKPLGLRRDDVFVCRSVALDDTSAANLALQCRLKTI